MTSSQQRQTIEHLTQVVSSTMGLREQLDVIRIVNPQAVVSATDTEFEIGDACYVVCLLMNLENVFFGQSIKTKYFMYRACFD